MAKLNVTQAAKAIGKDRKTIQRYIKNGQLSCEVLDSGRRLIDTSELHRVFGELKNPVVPDPERQKEAESHRVASENGEVLRQKIENLESRNEDLQKDKDDLKEALIQEQGRAEKREQELQSHIREQQQTMNKQLLLLAPPEPKPEEQHTATPQPVPNPAPVKKQGRLSKWWFGNKEVTGG